VFPDHWRGHVHPENGAVEFMRKYERIEEALPTAFILRPCGVEGEGVDAKASAEKENPISGFWSAWRYSLDRLQDI
jgi:hypothetical protein